MEDRYLSIPELVKYSNLSERYLRALIGSGKLKCFRSSPSGKILVRRSWFDEYVEGQMRKGQEVSQRAKRLVEEIFS